MLLGIGRRCAALGRLSKASKLVVLHDDIDIIVSDYLTRQTSLQMCGATH